MLRACCTDRDKTATHSDGGRPYSFREALAVAMASSTIRSIVPLAQFCRTLAHHPVSKMRAVVMITQIRGPPMVAHHTISCRVAKSPGTISPGTAACTHSPLLAAPSRADGNLKCRSCQLPRSLPDGASRHAPHFLPAHRGSSQHVDGEPITHPDE